MAGWVKELLALLFGVGIDALNNHVNSGKSDAAKRAYEKKAAQEALNETRRRLDSEPVDR